MTNTKMPLFFKAGILWIILVTIIVINSYMYFLVMILATILGIVFAMDYVAVMLRNDTVFKELINLQQKDL